MTSLQIGSSPLRGPKFNIASIISEKQAEILTNGALFPVNGMFKKAQTPQAAGPG
jgi:hypothetical protein